MSSRDDLQTLRRGLQALAILNGEGPVTVAELARRLDVPRANAHRIVSTLIREGYCRKIPNSHQFVATAQTQTALARPALPSALVSASLDIIDKLQQEIRWPVALSTPRGPTMVTRVATHLSTPWALDRIAPGHVASMFDASTGIVFLALTDEDTRAQTLAAASTAYPAAADEWRPRLNSALERVREQGHFLLIRSAPESSLGVPIWVDGQLVGGLAMRYLKSAANRSSIVETYLPRLFETAASIEAAVSRSLH